MKVLAVFQHVTYAHLQAANFLGVAATPEAAKAIMQKDIDALVADGATLHKVTAEATPNKAIWAERHEQQLGLDPSDLLVLNADDHNVCHVAQEFELEGWVPDA